MNITILLLLAYTVLVIAIGIYAGWNSSNEEYLIAGRDLGSIGVMTSIVASYIGGSALVAFTAYVYEYGVSMLSVFFGVAGGYIVFIWYAYQLRQRSEEDGFLTVSDLFYDGFDRKTGLISAVMIFFAFLGFLLNQFIAGSSILSDITGWSYSTGLFISAAVITLYLVLGGFNSVIKTDVFQYVILFLLLLLIGYTMSSGNTPEPIRNPAPPNWPMITAFIIYGIFNVFASADVWQRVYAARDDTAVRNGLVGAAVLVILGGAALTVIGASALEHYPSIEPRQAVVNGLSELLPPAIVAGGVVFLFAAIMSSADSILFVLATSIAKDYSGTERVADRTEYAILGITLFAVLLAYFFRDIVNVVLTVIGLQMALVPAVIAHFHGDFSSHAAFTSLLAGLLYIGGLVAFGVFEPTLAIASVLVAATALFVAEGVVRSSAG